MTKPDGGSAFPQIETDGETDYPHGRDRDFSHVYSFGGMSLRDYFAAQAIALNGQWFHLQGDSTPRGVAALAYEVADAMLAERDK